MKKNKKLVQFSIPLIIIFFIVGLFVGRWSVFNLSRGVFKQEVIKYLVAERKRECEDALGPSGYQFFNTFILEYPENNSGRMDNGENRIWIDCIKK